MNSYISLNRLFNGYSSAKYAISFQQIRLDTVPYHGNTCVCVCLSDSLSRPACRQSCAQGVSHKGYYRSPNLAGSNNRKDSRFSEGRKEDSQEWISWEDVRMNGCLCLYCQEKGGREGMVLGPDGNLAHHHSVESGWAADSISGPQSKSCCREKRNVCEKVTAQMGFA